ncbi:hypothetical protein BDAP_002277 [Binucleata daphniae]
MIVILFTLHTFSILAKEQKKSTLGLEANKLITGLSQKDEDENMNSDSDATQKDIGTAEKKLKKPSHSKSILDSLASIATDTKKDEKKQEQPVYNGNDMLMVNSTYQPPIARSLMDNNEKIEIDSESYKKLDETYNALKENVDKSESYLADISRIMSGMPKRDDKDQKKNAGGSDRLDFKIIEVNNDDKNSSK